MTNKKAQYPKNTNKSLLSSYLLEQILENENQDEILSLAGSRLSKPRS